MGDLILISDKTLLKKVGTVEFDYIISYMLCSESDHNKIYLTPDVYNSAIGLITRSEDDQTNVFRKLARFRALFASAYFIGEDVDNTSTPEDDLFAIHTYLKENSVFNGDEIIIISDEHSTVKTIPAIKINDFANWCSSLNNHS